MFTHADFNRSGRQIGRAYVTDGNGLKLATVWQFECGDIAYWVRGHFIAWPHQITVYSLYLTGTYRLFDRAQLGQQGTLADEQGETR